MNLNARVPASSKATEVVKSWSLACKKRQMRVILAGDDEGVFLRGRGARGRSSTSEKRTLVPMLRGSRGGGKKACVQAGLSLTLTGS